MKKKAIVTVGVSGSGKSTWAHNFCDEQQACGKDYVIVCRDDIRQEIYTQRNQGKHFQWSAWNWKWENDVTEEAKKQISDAASNPKIAGIIVADTNLNEGRLRDLTLQLMRLGFEVERKVFFIEFEEAVKRDLNRNNSVGKSVIAEQWEKFISMYPRKKYKADTSKPRAVIFDIDGTLAHKGNRGYFEWAKVGVDFVDESVRAILHACQKDDMKIIMVSGRDSVCQKETEEWCRRNFISFDALFMRSKNNHEDDRVIKEDIFWNHIADHYNVIGVFDDRAKVRRRWAEMGLKVFAVGNPDLEF